MAETVSKEAWIAFTKKRSLNLEDGLLVKALERLDRAGDADARLSALATLSDQIKKQIVELSKRKKELGDKLFGEAKDKLYELADGAERLQKELSQSVAVKSPNQPEADETPNSPALLTTAMIPLMKQVQGGDVTMHALIATTGKRAAVLVMLRPISPNRRSLLAEYLQESNLKYVAASCTGSAGAVDFQLDASSNGLSKLVRRALFDQTGLRLHVVTRFGDETEAAEEEDAPTPEAQYTARLKTTLPRITAVMATPTGQAARQVAVEARDLSRKGDFVGALAKLDQIDALLAEKPPAVDDAKSRRRAERWQAARDRYLDANDEVNEQLNSLRLALLNYVRVGGKYEDELPDIAHRGLNGLTGAHRVLLAAALQEIGDGHAQPMQTHGAKVLAQLQAFRTFLQSSPQINACDRNPFGVEVGIRRALEPRLQELAQILGETA